MLLALSVQDFVIVDRLRMEFAPGFTVLTGETGAGKSILVDALLLVLGGRGEGSVVRGGRDKAEITAEFDVRRIDPASRYLVEHDLSGDDGECILRRVIDAGGRSRAYINGKATTVAQLREVGEFLVDIHGQHEHQSLMRSSEQRDLLDAFAGAGGVVAEVGRHFREWLAASRAFREAEAGASALAEEQDRLAWQVQELRRLGLSQDEWRRIQSDHERLANAAALIEGAEGSIETLLEGDGAILSTLGAVASRLRQLATYDRELDAVVELMQSAEIQVKEVAYALRHYRQRLDLDPERLKEVEARMDAVVGMARKYRVSPEALPAALADLEARQAMVVASLDVEALRKQVEANDASFRKAAAGLSKVREKAARELGKAVTDAMQQLAMGGGQFQIALLPTDAPASFGLEQVEFRFAGHPGVAPAPVSKVASGGELARLSLAIQTVTSQVTPVPTQIFDEVDAGIGGGVAEIVGRMLRQLGNRRQVFCITHLPQVAAAADAQWRVTKQSKGPETLSTVDALDHAGRLEEIARMLGGVKITDTTRRHAAEMLDRSGP